MANPAVIRHALSAARLAPYLKLSGGDLVEALRLYAWNAEASAAFKVPLGELEVVVRNALHDSLSVRFGTNFWWDRADTEIAADVVGAFAKQAESLQRDAVRVTADDVVAKMTFGTWCRLLDKHHEDLWRQTLREGFPGIPKQEKRADVHRELDYLRVLRNRVAHLEPIIHRDLAADYDSVLRLINLVSADVAIWVDDISRVVQVISDRP